MFPKTVSKPASGEFLTVLTVLTLKRKSIVGKAAAVDGGRWLHMQMKRGQRWSRELWLCGEKAEPLSVDVEASRADEGAALPGRA